MTEIGIKNFSQKLLEIIPYLMRGMFRRYTDILGGWQITIPQYLALDFIEKNQTLALKDIASELNISRPAASTMIERLHKMQLIKRNLSQSDRRRVEISLSPKGKVLLAKIKARRQKAIEEVFSGLSQKERKNYLNILQKVKKIVYEK